MNYNNFIMQISLICLFSWDDERRIFSSSPTESVLVALLSSLITEEPIITQRVIRWYRCVRTHLTLGALDSGGGQRHHVLQLRQLRVRRPSKTILGTLLEALQLGLQLVRLPGSDVHLDRWQDKHTWVTRGAPTHRWQSTRTGLRTKHKLVQPSADHTATLVCFSGYNNLIILWAMTSSYIKTVRTEGSADGPSHRDWTCCMTGCSS